MKSHFIKNILTNFLPALIDYCFRKYINLFSFFFLNKTLKMMKYDQILQSYMHNYQTIS